VKTFSFGIIGISLVLLMVPWHYGGVTTSSWLLCSIILSLLFLALALRRFRAATMAGSRQRWLPHLSGLEVILLLFVLYPFAQLIPLPRSVVQMISPTRVQLEDMARRAKNCSAIDGFELDYYEETEPDMTTRDAWLPLSISPWRTFSAAVHGLVLLMWYCLLVSFFQDLKTVRLLFAVVILAGVSQAVYGLIEFLSGHQHVLTYYSQGRNFVSGSFINRNHCAAFLGLSFFSSLGLIFHLVQRIGPGTVSWRKKVSLIFSERNAGIFFWTVCSFLVGLGILFTKSRSGIICVGMGIFFLIFIHYHKHSAWKSLVFFLVILVLTFVMTGLTGVLDRFEILSTENFSRVGRFDMWAETLSIWQDYSLTGSGFNTFERIHPRYKQKPSTLFLEHAHNDYLEFFSEGGVIAFMLLALFGVLVLKHFFENMKKIPNEIFPLFNGAFVGMIVFALHEFTDFNGHILANQLVFILLLSLVLVRDIDPLLLEAARRQSGLTRAELRQIPGPTLESNSRHYQKPEMLN